MRRIHALTFVLAVTALIGCGSDSSTAPTQLSLAGTWNLTTVNGSPLPYVVQVADPKVEITGDKLVISATGTFYQETALRFTDGASVTPGIGTDDGEYTLNGSTASFKWWSDDGVGSATVSATTITIAAYGQSWVYQKQ
jgi:hypothetical protein